MSNTTLANRIVELERRLAEANAERAALVATVGALRMACQLAIDIFNVNDINVPNTIETLEDALNATPQHHLSELRAETAKAALLKIAKEYRPFGLQHSYTAFDVANHISAQAEYYANSIRRGEVTE